jgi:hypothetical protein
MDPAFDFRDLREFLFFMRLSFPDTHATVGTPPVFHCTTPSATHIDPVEIAGYAY